MYKDVYTMPGYCTNCDYRGDIEIPEGQRVPKPPQLFGFSLSGLPVQCPKCKNYSCYAN